MAQVKNELNTMKKESEGLSIPFEDEMTLQITQSKKKKLWNTLRTEELCKYKKWYRMLNSWRTEQGDSTYKI